MIKHIPILNYQSFGNFEVYTQITTDYQKQMHCFSRDKCLWVLYPCIITRKIYCILSLYNVSQKTTRHSTLASYLPLSLS